ncbi:MAG: helix-turn-helix transcriptional regulator [Tannerella sp.]|jgi:DNA-binding Xre family transcriptional regulator|nr:helix-turn-helix transcriptional regulator [Tannerella sp.]
MNYKNIHIGKLIQSFVKQNNMSSADLARKAGKTRQNIYDLYKRDDVEVKLLLTLCDVLQHNFIEDLYPTKKNDTPVIIDKVFDAIKELIEEKIKEKQTTT